MCYRQLRFIKNLTCGHLTFQGETYIDCCEQDCKLSSSHPTTCGSPASPCNCRRYYGLVQADIVIGVFASAKLFTDRYFPQSTPATDHTTSIGSQFQFLSSKLIEIPLFRVREYVHSACRTDHYANLIFTYFIIDV